MFGLPHWSRVGCGLFGFPTAWGEVVRKTEIWEDDVQFERGNLSANG